MSIYVTVDIGGTHIRAAAFSGDNPEPLRHERTLTRSEDDTIFNRIVHLIEKVWPEDQKVKAVGVASPGPLNPQTGTILATPNIPEWINFPLGPNLSRHFGVPVHLDNDANLAGLGEWRFGAGKGHHHVLYLTISTGIGGGVISNDRLLQGYHGLAAELGHVTIVPDGPICSCGYPGHIEALASGPAIARYVNEELKKGEKSILKASPDLGAQQIADAARQGDALAIAAYARAGEYLGIALANFLHIFDPSIVIFGGGVSQSGELLLVPLKTSLHERVFNPRYLENLIITTAALGDDAGLLGALALAQISES
jgi:glucokinase